MFKTLSLMLKIKHRHFHDKSYYINFDSNSISKLNFKTQFNEDIK